ncbi:hypothetical protein C8Q78DRAFT_1039077 [Trametes maxima]|nr:hypothetical protein C8Q78DRAFT_1039077 [Trametes maxima]
MDTKHSFDSPHPALNYDVLLAIMRHGDKQTVNRVMSTCSTLRREGAKLLLSDPVFISSDAALQSFLRFVTVHNEISLRYLRALRLDVGAVSAETASLFGRVLLVCMYNIETLSVPHAGLFFASHPFLQAAICRLRYLRNLTLQHVGKLKLTGMLSRLVTLEVSYAEPESLDAMGDLEGAIYHPAILCSAFVSTLTELRIQHTRRYGAVVVQSPFVYPRMRRLVLEDDWPYTVGYMTSFPKLTHLTIKTTHRFVPNLRERSFDLGAHLRMNRHTGTIVTGGWTCLEEVSGDAPGLHLLGLRCHVRQLRVSSMSEMIHLEQLHEVLHDVRPEVLDMTMSIRLLDDVTIFLGDMEPDVVRSLTSMRIVIYIEEADIGDEYGLDITNYLSVVHESLEEYDHLQTFELHLVLLADYVPIANAVGTNLRTQTGAPAINATISPPPLAAPMYNPPLSPTEVSYMTFDPRAFIKELGDAVPALRNAIITLGRSRTSGIRSVLLTRGQDGSAILKERSM